MLILSLSNNGHDNAAVIADDYRILAAIQRERISRVKGGCADEDNGGIDAGMVAEALTVANVQPDDIGQVVTSRGILPLQCLRVKPWRQFKNAVRVALGTRRKEKTLFLSSCLRKSGTFNVEKVLRRNIFLQGYGLPVNLPIIDSNHHYAHALSALFYTDWDNALVYTADGGGDNNFYSTYHYNGGAIHTLFGGDKELMSPTLSYVHSMGQVYGLMTKALGYKCNRHEGKLTGLAAFGKPIIYEELKKHYYVRDNGLVGTTFTSYREMGKRIMTLGRSVAPQDAAASVQKLLEKIILRAISHYLQKTNTNKIALAGGVFANVTLNQRVADLPGVEEVFIFPGMGDEGLAIGGVYDFLLRRDGLGAWQKQRHRLKNVYWGGAYDKEAQSLFTEKAHHISGDKDPATVAAQLLAAGKIVAIYHGRMEFGPRALGTRSILANPAKANINQLLNERLHRTEFMPFAPYVLEEDADDIFDVTPANRYAMRFMTITCLVKERWRKKIPAVTHVDGTARPQIINDRQNPLYAAVLRNFKMITGLPILINTSFNVHEEPIIYKPQECLKALNNERVDYIMLADGVYSKA